MSGRLALVGGDEFRASCESMDVAILAATGVAAPVVLIVPTAAAFENPARAADNGVRHFRALGADARPLMVLDHDDAMDAGTAAEVESADVVYLTGGNPAHLLDTLRDSLLLDAIQSRLDSGGTLAGSSAGAMVMGSWMRFRGEWTRTLGIAAGIATLPHHDRADPDTVVEELGSAPDDLTAVFGVDGAAGALSGTDGWTALGDGRVTVYEGGGWRRYEDGESFSIDAL
ncbi:MAG: Type 1 glutamine amidotransferase-like domain-containing protein [Dehalococcoidia bacterium]|nr:Type 1 glutamine amidotransferase-like domain-containing protein [Dehalococcoidia bacterium]